MKRVILSILGLYFFFVYIFYNIKTSRAGVYFIEKPNNIESQNNTKPCTLLGYKLTQKNCETNKILSSICPNDPTYGNKCICDPKFKYIPSNCINNKSLSGDSCDGKYEKCECDENIYKYNSSNCSSPQTLSGNYCGGKYQSCQCTTEYSQTCSGNLEGVGIPCDGKYKSCKCKSNFMICDNGGAAGADTCTDNSGTKYTSCQPSCIKNFSPEYSLSTTICPEKGQTSKSQTSCGETRYGCFCEKSQTSCSAGENLVSTCTSNSGQTVGDCADCRKENSTNNPCKGYYLCEGSKLPYGNTCQCGGYTYYEKCLVPEKCQEGSTPYDDTVLGKCNSSSEETSYYFTTYGYYKVGLKCTQQNGTKIYCEHNCNSSYKDILGNDAPCKGKITCPNNQGAGLCECGGKKYFSSCSEKCQEGSIPYDDTVLGKCNLSSEETSSYFTTYGYYKVGLKCTQQNGTKIYCEHNCNSSYKDILGNDAPCKGKITCPNNQGTGLCECGGKKYFSSCSEKCQEGSTPYDDTVLGKCNSSSKETSYYFTTYGYYKVGLKCTQQNGTKIYCEHNCNSSYKDILGNDAPCKGKIKCSSGAFATGETCDCGGVTYGTACATACNYEETPDICASKRKTFSQKCVDSNQNKFGECI